MAAHNDPRSMSIEAIDEYLAIADYCTTARKTDGGIYGYPSVLLLFCVIDAVSNYVGHTENTLREIRSIFPVLTDEQITNLKRWYRNLLAHQAIIMPGTKLSPDPAGAPIEFNSDREPTYIRVIPLCQAVNRWWKAFDKNRVSPAFFQNQAPKTPIATTLSPLPGTSGCINLTTAKP
jgi:hypothetical protein